MKPKKTNKWLKYTEDFCRSSWETQTVEVSTRWRDRSEERGLGAPRRRLFWGREGSKNAVWRPPSRFFFVGGQPLSFFFCLPTTLFCLFLFTRCLDYLHDCFFRSHSHLSTAHFLGVWIWVLLSDSWEGDCSLFSGILWSWFWGTVVFLVLVWVWFCLLIYKQISIQFLIAPILAAFAEAPPANHLSHRPLQAKCSASNSWQKRCKSHWMRLTAG